MRIFVPTRARIDAQITRREFFLDDPLLPYPVTYIVPESEHDRFKARWPQSKDIVVVPDTFKLSDIRQAIIEHHAEPDPFHVCMDDDLVFLRRWAPLDIRQRSRGTKAAPIRFPDAVAAFQKMESWLKDGYVHGALSPRGGNNTIEGTHKINGRACDCHFYRADVIKAEGLRFTDVTLRQDFHMTLSLLELGYSNVIDAEFMTGQSDGKPGGCQVYRTPEMLAQQAHLLAELHPGFVKVVEKERKGGFGVSTDVRISWAKAFRSRVSDRKWDAQ